MIPASRAPRLAFYGDDFTGSSDALEVLTFAGLRAAMFLAPPSPAMLARFPDLDAFGVAGDSRGMSVGEMDASLPAIFAALRASGANIVHYKVCSTFDSSPETGSIGRVITLARRIFANPYTPIVGGTPALARYCVFGNLFARSGTDGEVHRIDRHPIMSVHPVTPMREGDLARHIALQAPLDIAKLSYLALEAGAAAAREALERLKAQEPEAILFDSGSSAQLTEVGRLLAQEADNGEPLFVVGGSGVEYALTQLWREQGLEEPGPDRFARFAPVDRLLVVSGSASRLTAAQIESAIDAGFADIAVDPIGLLADEDAAGASLIDAAMAALAEGSSPLLHTVRGPDDPRMAAMRALGGDQVLLGRRLGQAMGRVLAGIQARARLTRIVVSGGDTSSQAVQLLAPDALEVTARLAPGVPLCRLHAAGARPEIDGVEIALKGGQMGRPAFFESVRAGRAG